MFPFDLLPHEVEDETARFGRVEAMRVTPFRQRPAVEFWLRRVTTSVEENLWFFQEARRGKRWNFVLTYEGTYDDYLAGQPISYGPDVELNEREFANCLKWDSWGRMLHFAPGELPVPGRFRATLGASGEGVWLDLNAPPESKEPCYLAFRWHPQACAKQLWDFDVDELRAHLKALALEAEHDVSFALRWSKLSPLERHKQRVKVRRGTWDEANELLTAALRTDISAVRNADWRWVLLSARVGHKDYLWRSDSADHYHETPPRLRVWKQLIFNAFEPYEDLDLCKRYWCVWPGDNEDDSLFNIRCTAPSAHEQMEALLKLRQWAKRKVPAARLRALFET